jgi:hypothetical protein
MKRVKFVVLGQRLIFEVTLLEVRTWNPDEVVKCVPGQQELQKWGIV